MKKALSAIALATALAAGSAQAADLPSRKAPVYVPPPPMITWTGFYAGLNLGGGWQDNSNNNWWGGNNGGSNAGVVGGGQIGYNYQVSPMFVVGVEADFQGSTIGSGGNNNIFNPFLLNPFFFGGGNGSARINWYGTVDGRVGITLASFPTLLIYGKGGFAYGEVQRNNWFWNNSAVQTGWNAGAGVEWMFLPNWSAKVEYTYHQLSGGNNNGFNFGLGLNNVNNRTRFHTIRAGVNYHFNWASPAPVLASY